MEIVHPVSHEDLGYIAFDLKGPYVTKMISVTPTQIVFDGYFRYESELFTKEKPIRRFVKFQEHYYVLGFTAKRTGEDTSAYFEDEDAGGAICLTPTEIIELDYVVLEKDPSKERHREIIDEIRRENEELREANDLAMERRMEREWQERKALWQKESGDV
jgi:hypothetical protein